MLEGLEISVISYTDFSKGNEIFRIDSSYFLKEYLTQQNQVRKKRYISLKHTKTSLKSFGAYSLNNHVTYQESGIPFIRGINMKKGRIDFSNTIYINQDAHKLLWKSEVKPLTIMLSMSGTLGDVALASPTWDYPINSNQDIAKITVGEDLNPYYLYLFLLSKYGQNYVVREGRGSVQQHVYLSQIEDFEIPILKPELINKVEHLVKASEESMQQSQKTYSQAEKLLLDTLGLSNFQPSEDGVNVKSFKDSFLESGRLDSEYYLKKYEQIVLKIKSQKHNTLSNLVNIKKSIEPGSKAYDENKGVPFVRVADLTKYGISTPSKNISDFFYKTNASKLNKLKIKEDTVLLSKDGSVGISYAVKEDLEMITSGAILHLMIKDGVELLPEYLSLVLNSQTTQLQAERDAGGSIILHWRVGEIENVLIPLLDIEIQKEIQKLVTSSFDLRSKSEALLEIAKRGVEMAIEQDEEVAMEWMEKELDKIGVDIKLDIV